MFTILLIFYISGTQIPEEYNMVNQSENDVHTELFDAPLINSNMD